MKTLTFIIIMSVSVIMLTEGCKGKINEPEGTIIQTEETSNDAVEIIPKTEITQRPQLIQTKKNEKKQYEVQLLSSKDLKAVVNVKNNLLSKGFKCRIVTKNMNGERHYRLRLRDIFTHTDANNIGKEIVIIIPSVTGYWVQKVN